MILKSASDKVTKTKIMYKAYLSYAQLKEYLEFLEKNNLIKYEGGANTYTTTEKGWEFLHAYNDIVDIVSIKDNNGLKNII